MRIGSAGRVKKRLFKFACNKNNRMILESGKRFGPITIAYETYGQLNQNKDNTILIQHTLTMDSHAAGVYENGGKSGWWDGLIGPAKAFDTEKYFIVCSNIFGGCSGSTGPSSIDPEKGHPYGTDFPFFSFSDVVKIQRVLIRSMGITKIFSVAGGSMGGMLALQWAADFPDEIRSVIPIASAWKQSPMQIALSEISRQSIINDLKWKGGDYYKSGKPDNGLALARMIGHITYMSDASMEKKFARNLKNGKFNFSFDTDFEVENYLHYRGKAFVDRFDANSYLYISKALNYFDVSGDTLTNGLSGEDISFLVISFESDWLYPARQSEEMVRYMISKNIDVSYCKIESTYGHDAFLLEINEESKLIKNFLERIRNE